MLDGFEPIARFLYPGLVHVDADFSHADCGLPGAIDVVDAPASPPASFRLLCFFDVIERTHHCGVRSVVVEMRERFERAAGDVRAGGILNGVVVGEGDFFEQRDVVGFVEGGETAIVVLHGQDPVDAALGGGGGLVATKFLQGHGHHRGVVDIGVVRVVVFKAPSGGGGVGGQVVGPVAFDGGAFLGDEPIGGAFGGGVRGVEAGVGEGVGGVA